MTEHVTADATQKLHFYQKGTFTVGNRLLAEAQRSVQASIEPHQRADLRATAPARAAARRSARATPSTRRCGRPTATLIAVNATGCLEVFTTPYPETSWQMPWLHSLFGNAAAVATGVAAAMRVKGRPEVRVIAQGGDGGTTDIGFGCLSGMFERNDDVLYICYDNEGLHEHRRAALLGDAARRAHRDDAGHGRRARQRVRHRQERAADRRGPRHPLRRHRDRRRPA